MTAAGLISFISASELSKNSQALLLLDVRSNAEFEDRHIKDAVHLPLDELPGELTSLDRSTGIVVVCKSGKRAARAAELLESMGFKPSVLEGGLTAWIEAGLPTEKGRQALSIERQTQLTIGLGLLTGLGLSFAVSRWFLVLPAVFGAGLTYAGLSGNCGLAMLLAKAPWNQHKKAKASGRGCVNEETKKSGCCG